MSVNVRGVGGELRWGYHCAARLRAFSVTGTTLTGTIDTHDDYRVTQRPLVFALPAKGWVWPIDTLQIEGTALTASLTSDEESPHG